MRTSRDPTETTLQHYQRLKDGIADGEVGLNWSQIYALVFPDADLVSSDHARKVFRGFDLALAADEGVAASVSNIGTGDAENESTPIPRHKNEVEHNRDGTLSSTKLVEMQDSEAKNPAFLLEAHGFDVEDWEIVSAKNSIWQAHCKGGSTKTLYSSKITVKPKKNEVNMEFVRDLLIENCLKHKKIEPAKITRKPSEQILEVNISDLHLGKLCWAGETSENYNHKTASERFKHIIHDILKQTEHLDFERIYLIWSNDFYHYDTVDNKTTAGTSQDTALRWQQLFRIGVELLVWGIDQLSQKAHV